MNQEICTINSFFNKIKFVFKEIQLYLNYKNIHFNSMKRSLLSFCFLLICIPSLFAQVANTAAVPAPPTDAKAIKYRRSSLHMIMLDDKGLVNADLIKRTFIRMPIPDKFNNHLLAGRSFDPKPISVTAEERKLMGQKQSFAESKSRNLGGKLTGGLVDTTNTEDIPIKIEKYFNANYVARDLVAKWFNRSEKGTFDMKLIGERGSYDASALDIATAKSSKRGVSAVADAGEELINNTFVVVTRYNYVSMENVAAAAKKAGKFAASLMAASGNTIDSKVLAAGDSLTSQATGYAVETNSYLYKLVWNDSVEAVFYQSYWIDESSYDEAKKRAFDTTHLFTLQYIGDAHARANVLASNRMGIAQDTLIAKATINSFEAVIAKLQKKYEVFRTKTPLLSGDPITAKIGLKEGLEAGDKFEVLEQVLDEKTGRTTYKRVGKIKVKSGMIWDNRFGAEYDQAAATGQPVAAQSTAAVSTEEASMDDMFSKASAKSQPVSGATAVPTTPVGPIDRTTFIGEEGSFYSGMLIRQRN